MVGLFNGYENILQTDLTIQPFSNIAIQIFQNLTIILLLWYDIRK